MRSIKPLLLYLSLDALFEGGRMFVGATGAAYLLQSGVGLSEIAFLKSLQALLILVCEFPTGLFADAYGHRRSLVVAAICAFIGFTLYFIGGSLSLFLVAEAFTALALCFWSGAYEAYAIESAKLESEPGLIDRFFHLNQGLNNFMVLSCGFVGGWLALKGLSTPYLGAMVAMTVAGLMLLILKDSQPLTKKGSFNLSKAFDLSRFKAPLLSAVREGLGRRELLPFFLANIAIQFVIQPILHYWQPMLQGLGAGDTRSLGFVFSAYCATSMVAAFCYAHFVAKRPFFRTANSTFVIFGLFAVFYALTGLANSWTAAAVFFCLMQGLLSVGRTSLSARLNERIDSKARASILSSVSLISRLGMILALGSLSLALNGSLGNLSQGQIYIAFAVMALALTILGWLGTQLLRSKAKSTALPAKAA